MSFLNYGLTKEEIRERERKEREYWERARERQKQTNDYISRLHQEHIARMKRMREENHRQFLRLIRGRSY